jgi:hypothetical protein
MIEKKINLIFRAGKSYTMQGVNIPGSPQRGVIPRSFEVRFYVFEEKLLYYIFIFSIYSKLHR